MIIGSLSGWLWLAGITARPRATSSRTSSAGTPSRAATNAISAVTSPGPRPLQLRAPVANDTRPRQQGRRCRSIDRVRIGVRARRVVQVEVLAVGQVHLAEWHPRAPTPRGPGSTWRLPAIGPVVTETGSDNFRHRPFRASPTPALPGQVRTVDSPSCPLSALGVRSRVWTVCQASAGLERLPAPGRIGIARHVALYS